MQRPTVAPKQLSVSDAWVRRAFNVIWLLSFAGLAWQFNHHWTIEKIGIVLGVAAAIGLFERLARWLVYRWRTDSNSGA